MTIDTTKGIAGLKGALRYVRAYRDQVFVVKLGGEVLGEPEVLDQVTAQLALLSSLSIRLVVVHGGGPQATALSRRLGAEARVDRLAWGDVVGTLAGDDTIFLAVRNASAQRMILRELRRLAGAAGG